MTTKQRTTHMNKDSKKAKPTSLPKQIKRTKGLSKESMGGGPMKKKGKSL